MALHSVRVSHCGCQTLPSPSLPSLFQSAQDEGTIRNIRDEEASQPHDVWRGVPSTHHPPSAS